MCAFRCPDPPARKHRSPPKFANLDHAIVWRKDGLPEKDGAAVETTAAVPPAEHDYCRGLNAGELSYPAALLETGHYRAGE